MVPRDAVVPRRTGVPARIADVPVHDQAVLGPDGLRCLRPVRACADLLRLLALTVGVVVADAVQHAGVCSAADLQDELCGHAGLRGVVRARRVLALSDPLAESPPESRLRLTFVLAGLAPVAQHVVRDGQGRVVARVDLALPGWRLAVEHDGRAVHERPDVSARDRQRQNELVRAGWTVLRLTAADLRWGASAMVAQVSACAAAA